MLDLHGLLTDIPEVKGHAPGKNQEYVNGWGIFALPFESGDVANTWRTDSAWAASSSPA
jgi:hypothetical protein